MVDRRRRHRRWRRVQKRRGGNMRKGSSVCLFLPLPHYISHHRPPRRHPRRRPRPPGRLTVPFIITSMELLCCPYLNDDLAANGGEVSQDSFSGEIFGPLTTKGSDRGGFGALRFRECKHVPSPAQDWQTGGSGKTTRPLSTRIAQFGPSCWTDA